MTMWFCTVKEGFPTGTLTLDDNVVLYCKGGIPNWHTDTWNWGNDGFEINSDGELVVNGGYNDWNSGTKGQSLFVILGPFGELRHNKGFPLALYSYGVSRNTKKTFTPTEEKKVPKIATPFLPVFSALAKNSNFALDWSRNENGGTKVCRMSSRIEWDQAEVAISSASRDNWIIKYAHNRFWR
eukprot:sb/3471544/